MHYANGRPAKNGDKVLQVLFNNGVVVGILYDAVAGNDYCNGMLAPSGGGAHIGACLADCVHIDDVLAVLGLDLKSGKTREQLSKIPYRLDN